MPPVEMHLNPFSDKLKLMPEPFCQHPGMPFGIDDFSPKGFSSSAYDLLNLCDRFLVHIRIPQKVGKV